MRASRSSLSRDILFRELTYQIIIRKISRHAGAHGGGCSRWMLICLDNFTGEIQVWILNNGDASLKFNAFKAEHSVENILYGAILVFSIAAFLPTRGKYINLKVPTSQVVASTIQSPFKNNSWYGETVSRLIADVNMTTRGGLSENVLESDLREHETLWNVLAWSSRRYSRQTIPRKYGRWSRLVREMAALAFPPSLIPPSMYLKRPPRSHVRECLNELKVPETSSTKGVVRSDFDLKVQPAWWRRLSSTVNRR